MKYSPMLCRKKEYHKLKDMDLNNYTSSIKFDGSRIICEKKNGEVELYTRSGNKVTDRFPEIKFDNLKDGVFDGEITTKGGFRNTLKRINTEDKFRIKILSKRLPSTYMVFDILEKGGKDLRDKPLSERKKVLDDCIENSKHIKKVKHKKNIKELWEDVKENGGEGIVVKKLDSTYTEGKRSKNWLKIKTVKTGEFQVVGYKKSDKRPFRSLILGKGSKYVGNVGTGFTDKELKVIKEEMDKIKTGEKPFLRGFQNEDDYGEGEVVWLKAGIPIEVEYLEMNDKLRHPSFRKFLTDRQRFIRW